MGFNPCNCALKIRESIETPTPKVGVPLGMWGSIPSHSLALPGFPLWPTTLQPPCLGREPKARVATHLKRVSNIDANMLCALLEMKVVANYKKGVRIAITFAIIHKHNACNSNSKSPLIKLLEVVSDCWISNCLFTLVENATCKVLEINQ
jgi:hypothetical protein